MFNIGLCNRILVDFYVKPRAIYVFFYFIFIGVGCGRFFPFRLAGYYVSFMHGQKLRSVSLRSSFYFFSASFFWVRGFGYDAVQGNFRQIFVYLLIFASESESFHLRRQLFVEPGRCQVGARRSIYLYLHKQRVYRKYRISISRWIVKCAIILGLSY